MTAHLIDKEIRQIIDEQYEKALEILRSNRDVLEQTAKKLLVSESIEGEDLKVLEAAVRKQSDLDHGDTSDHRHAMAA
jgi:cell division protease FtsH